MASPHVHYDVPTCPHPGCSHHMEWIDFKLELHGTRKEFITPLVRAMVAGHRFRWPMSGLPGVDSFYDPQDGGSGRRPCGPVSPAPRQLAPSGLSLRERCGKRARPWPELRASGW